MTYGLKVADFCIKSGRVTGRKRATNSLKANGVVLVNEMALCAALTLYL